jgi:hypothetical protein
MLVMPINSLQALPCSLRAVYPLYVGIFPTLLRSIATLQAGLSATSGSCSSLVRSRSWTATAAVPRMFW